MNQYNVKIVKEKDIDWDNIEELTIDNYPWYETGLKQTTHVKTLIHEKCIKIKAYCEDIHSYSKETKLNGDVYLDSCFEFFVTPEDNLGGGYFNIEMNCCGVLHMSYKNKEGSRIYCNEKQADRVSITSSIQTKTKNEAEDDRYWELLILIPIEVLEEMSGKQIKYENETWYGNFYRCGGKTEPQYATWNNIEFEYPNFHLPKQFGKLLIS